MESDTSNQIVNMVEINKQVRQQLTHIISAN